jgi:hypothetical protein
MIKRISSFIIKYPAQLTFLLCILFYFLPFKPKPFGDGEYHKGTLQLIDFIKHGFSGQVDVSKGLFTLIYYLVPYSILHFFQNDKILLLGGIIFNWCSISLGVHLLFKAFKEQCIEVKIQVWIFLLMNLFPIHIYYSMGILSEAAAFMLVSAFVYYLGKVYYQTENRRNIYVLLSVSLALFISVRPNFLPYALSFLLIIPFIKTAVKNKIVLAIAFILPLLLLYFIEKKLDHTDAEFKKFQLVKGFVWSRYELRDEPFNWLPQHGMDKYASSDYKNNIKKRVELMQYCKEHQLDLQTYARNWMLNDIKTHPGLFVRQTCLKYFQSQTMVVTPLLKSKKSSVIKYGVHAYINLLNYILLLSVFYAVFLFVKRRKDFSIYLPLLLLYATAFITIFFIHSEQRYVFPTRPHRSFKSSNHQIT